MSWVKAVMSSDDVFDEDMDDISLQNKEWSSNMEKRTKSSSCDHTVDETRGLLNSDSKALGSVEGAEVQGDSLPKQVAEDRSKHEGEDAGPQVVTVLPDAVAKSPEAHAESSYSSVIQSLHTENSRAEQAHQSASLAGVYMTNNTGTTEETGEVPNTPMISTEVPIEVSTTEVTEETEAKMANGLAKMDEQVITVPGVQVAPLEETRSQEATAEKSPRVQGETEQEVSETDSEKTQSKEPAEVWVDEDTTQTKESTSKISMTDRHDAEDLLTLNDMVKNAAGVEMRTIEHRSAKPQVSSSEPASEMDVVEKDVSAQVISAEHAAELADHAEDTCEEDMSSEMAEVTEDSLPSDAQEHSKQVSSPDMELSIEPTPHDIENGQPDNLGDLRDENTSNVDAALMLAALQETETSPTTRKEPLCIGSHAQLLPEPSSNISSIAEQVDKPESRDTAADQEKITLSIDKEEEVAESQLNSLDSSAPVQKPEFPETPSDAVEEDDAERKSEVTGPSEALSLDEHSQEEEESEAQRSAKAKQLAIVVQETIEKENSVSHKGQKGEIILTSSHAVEVAVMPLTESESFADQKEQDESEDLYQGAEEIEKESLKEKRLKALLEITIPGVDESCSLAAVIDILAYSESEWKGNTAKSALIRKGYSEMSCSFSGLRRVRGDNYCALRATLFQVLATTTQTPAWLLEDDFTSLPEKLEAQEHLIGGWMFPLECNKVGEKENAVEKLKCYLELLQKKWQTAAETESPEEKQLACERTFQGREEEYGLLEALKLLMLARAVEFHSQMHAGQDVPVFCWLLFARDTSGNPRTFLTNHLSQVGFSGGLEQVEMFLLGYALQHTIQAFRLYMMDTEEFVTHYPDDHKQDWPCVSIVTEDDRHYNVPVRKAVQQQNNNDIAMLLPLMS
uniref:OTU domain-containing protein n=1 Tax=Electrophorus electricus TaxID=8005 RepID=A0A4W4ETR7_ELEEL